ncbi:suppressor protein SRP40-like [Morus notabilis]|uniref:suppressor protein SRP40-like n=1 Tax=Morus notabilis TaxID=981085 RepID=UPI000CECF6FB|nr:suppressor protein SRP40-like [Morus notabilis]
MTHEIFKDLIWSDPSGSKSSTSTRPTSSKSKTTRMSFSSEEEDEPVSQKPKPAKEKRHEYPHACMVFPSKAERAPESEIFSRSASASESDSEPSESPESLPKTETDSKESEEANDTMDITQLLMATSTGSNDQQTQTEMGEPTRESSPIVEEPPDTQ